MKTQTGDPIGYYEGNCHTVRTIDGGNITILRSATRNESLSQGEYFMRLNPSDKINLDGVPDTCAGMTVISRNYHYVWLPGHKVVIVAVKDINNCFVMK